MKNVGFFTESLEIETLSCLEDWALIIPFLQMYLLYTGIFSFSLLHSNLMNILWSEYFMYLMLGTRDAGTIAAQGD